MDLLAAYASDSEDGEPNSSTPACLSQENGSDPCTKRIKLDSSGTASEAATARPKLPDPTALLGGSKAATEPSAPARPKQQQPAVQAASAKGTGLQLTEPARVRAFPHVEGNFATVAYVPVPDTLQQELQSLTSSLMAQCPGATTAGGAAAGPSCAAAAAAGSTQQLRLWSTFPFRAGRPTQQNNQQQQAAQPHILQQQQQQQASREQQQLPLHMSVSRTVPIRHIQIASLKAALAKQLKGFRPFKVQLHGLVCLVNDNGSRSFVGLKVAAGQQQVVRLVQAVNRAFITHGLQPFYEDPVPHVSLAWSPDNQAGRLQPWLDNFTHSPITLQVSQVVCQVGKAKHLVWES